MYNMFVGCENTRCVPIIPRCPLGASEHQHAPTQDHPVVAYNTSRCHTLRISTFFQAYIDLFKQKEHILKINPLFVSEEQLAHKTETQVCEGLKLKFHLNP
jgi:hypothetical protein